MESELPNRIKHRGNSVLRVEIGEENVLHRRDHTMVNFTTKYCTAKANKSKLLIERPPEFESS